MKWTQATVKNLPSEGKKIPLMMDGEYKIGFLRKDIMSFSINGDLFPYRKIKFLDESLPSTGEDVQRMAEETVKEIAGIAWKGAANAYRMYPDNKHTFSDYWEAAKNQFSGYAAHTPAPSGMEEAYVTYEDLAITASEMEWPEEVLDMIKKLVRTSTPPAKEQWVKIEEGGKMPEEGQQIICENNVGNVWRTQFYGFADFVIRWMPYTPPTT